MIASYSNIVSALTVILLYNFVPMLLGMVTLNATTFLIGQNSLACLNDFLQNNDKMADNGPRRGLADHAVQIGLAVLTNILDLETPGQSHNRVNG